MSLVEWIPAISTTSLLAVVLWLLRSAITTRLKASVQYEFDQKVEKLKTVLRKNEESFKADMRSNETQIEALRTGALSGLASRQAALDSRRIVAVDQLWSAVQALAPAKFVSATIAVLKFEAASKISSENPKMRTLFEATGGQVDPITIHTGEAEKARPFVSEIAWAIFSAYRAILSVAMIKMHMLKNGLDSPGLIDEESVQRLISLALPHQKNLLDNYGAGAYHYLLDELETNLLNELRKVLQGKESDMSTIKQAGEILRESENMMGKMQAKGTEQG